MRMKSRRRGRLGLLEAVWLLGLLLPCVLDTSNSIRLRRHRRQHNSSNLAVVERDKNEIAVNLTGVWRWTPIDNSSNFFPRPRKGHTATYVKGQIFVYGGTQSIRYGAIFDDLWILHIEQMKWTLVEPQHNSGQRPPGLVSHTATYAVPT